MSVRAIQLSKARGTLPQSQVTGLRRFGWSGGGDAIVATTVNNVNANATVTQFNSRVRYFAKNGASGIRLVYWNGNLNSNPSSGEVGGGGDVTYKASIGYPLSTSTPIPVFFAGKRAGIAEPGAMVTSDLLGIDIPAGSYFWVYSYAEKPLAANSLGLNCLTTAANGESTRTGGYYIDDGSNFTNGDGNNAFGPHLILGSTGSTLYPTVGLLGDSNFQGLLTNTVNRNFATLGLNEGVAYVVLGRTGELTTSFLINSRARMFTLLRCTHIVINYGTNDISGGASAATTYANLVSIGQMMYRQGIKAYVCTLPPKTTGTFTSEAAQTVTATEAARLSLNALIRAITGTPTDAQPFSGYFDPASYVESNGKWKLVGGQPTTDDGTHYNALGKTAASASISSGVFVIA